MRFSSRLFLTQAGVISISLLAVSGVLIRSQQQSQESALRERTLDRGAMMAKTETLINPVLQIRRPCDSWWKADEDGQRTRVADSHRVILRVLFEPDSPPWPELKKACASQDPAPQLFPFLFEGSVPFLATIEKIASPEAELRLFSLESLTLGVGPGEELSLVDRTGSEVFGFTRDALGKPRWLSVRAERIVAADVQPGHLSGRFDRGGDWEVIAGFSAPGSAPYAWVSKVPRSKLEAPVRRDLALAGSLTLFFLFAGLFAARLLARGLAQSLVQVRDLAHRLGQGELTADLELNGPQEAIDLKHSLRSLAERITGLLSDTQKEAELKGEVAIAQRVQSLFTPRPNQEFTGLSVSSEFRTASQCGGDWTGFCEIRREGKKPLFLVLLGDATGHGIGAALLTAAAQGAFSSVRMLFEKDPALAEDPQRILKFLNRSIHEAALGELQMTCFCAVIDHETQELRSSVAAHPSAYLLPAQGTIQSLGSGGTPLGADAVFSPTDTVTKPWSAGYRLIVYSDGLTDSGPGGAVSSFDRRALQRLLKANATFPGKELLQVLVSEFDKALGGAKAGDDLSLVVIEGL